ncbi:sodium/sulphate symporter, putative [Bodo saltans]|uniref:Sodium/sulphate symporter, putative n=1 Tax=Bodo saltans TaxID=75058 RepID=A0A0S4IUS9_BODSA|nr:sodium/sulphate symporter, putative [Bodo saltans]|eukprot:CUF95375.1 sodium/sulphate symporter, putative [Bodo saltans]
MKFGKRMQEEMLEHWAAYYVSYKRLKQLCIRSPLRGERFTTELFKVIREELKKAEDHFRTLLEELTVQHDTLVASEQLDRDSPVAPRGTPHNFAGSFFPQRKSKRRHHKSGDEALQGTEMTNAAGNTSITEINASFPEGNNSGYSSVDNEQQHASAPKPWERNEDEGLCSKIMSPMKSVFMRIISQSTRSAEGSGDIRVLRSQFIEWYASAHRLEHFAELNLEALRKTLKKLVKHRGEEGDFTNAVEAEIAMSPLSTLLPKLHQMSTMISQDFHRRFDEPLDMYKDLVMNTKEQWHAKWRFVLLSAIVFGAAMSSPIFVEHAAAHKCFALFALVVTMWITEAIPFFCTAMLIPIVAVPLGILRDPTSGEVASPVISSRIMLSHVFDHVQILVLGGLTIAKALSKVRLEDVAASWLHVFCEIQHPARWRRP